MMSGGNDDDSNDGDNDISACDSDAGHLEYDSISRYHHDSSPWFQVQILHHVSGMSVVFCR